MPHAAFAEIRNLALFSPMADENFAALMRGAYVQNAAAIKSAHERSQT